MEERKNWGTSHGTEVLEKLKSPDVVVADLHGEAFPVVSWSVE